MSALLALFAIDNHKYYIFTDIHMFNKEIQKW